MDPKELRAAADSVLADGGTGTSAAMYWDVDEGPTDAKALAAAYLAEHPADEEEPITGPWSESVAGEVDRSDPEIAVYYHRCQHLCVSWMLDDGIVYVKQMGTGLKIAVPCATRGQLRRLCAALGGPLTEPTT